MENGNEAVDQELEVESNTDKMSEEELDLYILEQPNKGAETGQKGPIEGAKPFEKKQRKKKLTIWEDVTIVKQADDIESAVQSLQRDICQKCIWSHFSTQVSPQKMSTKEAGSWGGKSKEATSLIFHQRTLGCVGGRIIDDRRASMSIETMQMLLCGNDWIQNLHGLKNKSREPLDILESFTIEEIGLPYI